jgi:hypothetical protein
VDEFKLVEKYWQFTVSTVFSNNDDAIITGAGVGWLCCTECPKFLTVTSVFEMLKTTVP